MATIVSLHAHPDDEALLTGGWLAQRASAGDRVVLVFATDGNAGLASPGYGVGTLGEIRRAEGHASAEVLGAARVAWLGYADSGMADVPTASPGRLVDTPVDDVARAVAAILDEEDADVLTGYDANGGYGHPDHNHVHQIARKAQDIAVRRPKLLEATRDRTWLLRLLRVVRPIAGMMPGLTIPGEAIYTARADVTLTIDVSNQLDPKRAALAAHRSQATGGLRTVALLLALPRPLARRVLGTEWFREVL
jgi:LmbE family N-acetylglucosaminyl deacetylase